MRKVTKREIRELPIEELDYFLWDDPESGAAKVYLSFITLIHERMKKYGLKQKDIAKSIIKSPSCVSRTLRRETDPTLATMVELLSAVGLKFKEDFSAFVEKK